MSLDAGLVSVLSEADRALGVLLGLTMRLDSNHPILRRMGRGEESRSRELEGFPSGKEFQSVLVSAGDLRFEEIWSSNGYRHDGMVGRPHPAEIPRLLRQIRLFLKEDRTTPPIIRALLIHYQLDTIAPQPVANGILARQADQFLLMSDAGLPLPLLPLSEVYSRVRRRYRDVLQRVREEDDIVGWIRFGVRVVHNAAVEAAARITNGLELLDADARTVSMEARGRSTGSVLDLMTRSDAASVEEVAEYLDVSFPTANAALQELLGLGIIVETTGNRRNRRFRYQRLLEIVQPESAAGGP